MFAGFFLIACACLNVLYIICATRVNIVFVLIFFTACLGFILAASARWVLAEGNLAVATKLVTVSYRLNNFVALNNGMASLTIR